MQAFHPVKEVSGKPGYEAPTIEENKGGVMGFMNYWTSDRKIKPAQIENIELYSIY